MKEMFPGSNARLVAALMLALIAAVVVAFAAELGSRYRWANDTLDTIEPRYARLAGLVDAAGPILARNSEAEGELARLAHGADVEIARLGTDLQQRIRRIAAETGVGVTGSQILPTREEGGVMVVTVAGTMNGEIGAIAELMLRLESEVPPVFVEKMLVQTSRTRQRGAEPSSDTVVQATMSVLRLQP